jgi:hypothetical protein
LPDKLLGPYFLGAKNKEGELLNRNKSIQDDYLSNLQALKPIIDQMAHYDMKGVFNVPLVYDDTGLTFEDRFLVSAQNSKLENNAKGVLNVPSVYDDTGLTFKDCFLVSAQNSKLENNATNPIFSLVDISQNWN